MRGDKSRNCFCGEPQTGKLKVSNTQYKYTGKAIKPALVIKDGVGKKLVKNVDYTVIAPKNSKAVGKYKATIKFIGKYTGKATGYFKIVPKTPKIKAVTVGKKIIIVNMATKPSKVAATKYEITYRVKVTALKVVKKVKYYSSYTAIKTSKKVK